MWCAISKTFLKTALIFCISDTSISRSFLKLTGCPLHGKPSGKEAMIQSWRRCSNTTNNTWDNSNSKFTETTLSHTRRNNSWASDTWTITWTCHSVLDVSCLMQQSSNTGQQQCLFFCAVHCSKWPFSNSFSPRTNRTK